MPSPDKGTTSVRIPKGLAQRLDEYAVFSPNGYESRNALAARFIEAGLTAAEAALRDREDFRKWVAERRRMGLPERPPAPAKPR